MGRWYSFELFVPIQGVADALNAINGLMPTVRRKRAPHPRLTSLGLDLKQLTPDTPLFAEMLSLLFPADEIVRGWRLDWPDDASEWTDDGVECLPVGGLDLEVRAGTIHALLTCHARTSSISDVFQNSPSVWATFTSVLHAGGGQVGLFNDWDGERYPLLPGGVEAIELNFFDFVLEERDLYWHLDVDAFASAALSAPRIPSG